MERTLVQKIVFASTLVLWSLLSLSAFSQEVGNSDQTITHERERSVSERMPEVAARAGTGFRGLLKRWFSNRRRVYQVSIPADPPSILSTSFLFKHTLAFSAALQR